MGLLNLFRLQWDRGIAILMAAVGLIALLLGYIGTSGTPHVAEQLPYFISGGLFGIFCLTVAAIAWISADLRDEWRELRGLRGLLEEELSNRVGSDRALTQRHSAEELSSVYPTGSPELVGALRREASEVPAPPKRRARKATPAVEQ